MKVDNNLTKSSKDDEKKEDDDKNITKSSKDDEKKEDDDKSLTKSDKKIPEGMVEIEFRTAQCILILSKRNTGKSFLTKYLIHNFINQGIYDTIYLFSTTERYSHSFNCLPKEYVIDKFDLKFIQNVIDCQRKQIDKYGLHSEKTAKNTNITVAPSEFKNA